jgi:hypothetical protein
MIEFKVGDKVKVVKSGWGINEKDIGSIVEITQVVSCDSYATMGLKYTESPNARGCSFELFWQPKPGELVEARDGNCAEWERQYYVGEQTKSRSYPHICEDEDGDIEKWEQIRRIETPEIILTIDGKKVELSAESIQSIIAASK